MGIGLTPESGLRREEGLERVHAMMARLLEDVRRFIASAVVKGHQK